MTLSIIIVNFNTLPFLEKCLDSLWTNYSIQLKKKEYEILVVDNNSKEDPSLQLKEKFPMVTWIRNRENMGFSAANNIGIKKAKGEYVLLLNPDTEVPAGTLPVMVDFMQKNPDVGVATCKVLLPTGYIDDASHRGFPTPWRALTHFSGVSKLFPHSLFFNGYHLGYQNMNITHEIDSAVGAFMLIRRTIGVKLSWLDEDYFWYGEDLDFCYRVKQAGYKVMYVPEVTILHHKGVASGIKKHSQHVSLADSETKKLATKARFDVMRTFYQKHYMDKYPKLVMISVFFGIRVKQWLTELSTN